MKPFVDNFRVKMSHIETLFTFIKSNKEEQFLEYLSSIPKSERDVNIKDKNGNSLIFFAIIKNNKRIVSKLIEYGAHLDTLDSEGYSILYWPIKFDYVKL